MKSARRVRFLFPSDMVTPDTASFKAVEIVVSYSEGGLNYWNYKREPRGYVLSAVPVTIGRTSFGVSTQYTIGDARGFKVFLGIADRFNAKRLADHVARTQSVHQPIASAIAAGDTDEARRLVGPFLPVFA